MMRAVVIAASSSVTPPKAASEKGSSSTGMPDLRVEWVPRPTLAGAPPTSVLLKVHSFGVNRGDLMQRRGHYPPPPGASTIMGLEAAGEVVEVGDGVRGDLATSLQAHPGRAVAPASDPNRVRGSRVTALLAGGAYAEYVVVDARHCIPVPDDVPLPMAAAVPEAYCTAFQTIVVNGGGRSRLGRAGEGGSDQPAPPFTVLVHAGASGVGLACVDVARRHGTRVVTTSSADKVAACLRAGADHAIARHGLPAPGQVVAATACCFAADVEAAVGPEAIDLVVDPVFGTAYTQENFRVLRRNGGVVVLSFLNGPRLADFDARVAFRKNNWLKFSTLRDQSADYKADLVEGLRASPVFTPAFPISMPIAATLVGLDRVTEAHGLLERNATVGKVVVSV